MRKFKLFDRVNVQVEIETGKEQVLGSIVGFTTDEEDGVIIDKETGGTVEPDEHSYLVMLSEINMENEDASLNIAEYFESDIKSAQ